MSAMANYRRTSHTKFDIKLHFVWITKYRKPFLVGTIATRVRDLVRQGGGRHLLDRKRRSISYARSVIFCRLTVPIDLIQFSFR